MDNEHNTEQDKGSVRRNYEDICNRKLTARRGKTTSPGTNSKAHEGGERRGRLWIPILLSLLLLLALIGGIAYAFVANKVSDSDTEDSPTHGQEGDTDTSGVGSGTPIDAVEQGADTSDVGNGMEAAAIQAVKDFYTHAAALDYDAASDLLTIEQLSSTFSTRDRFVATFNTLISVSFVEEPKVEVSGSTAKVVGITIARHTDRTERNRATWTLVNEDGGWRISGWTVSPISVEPV